MIASLDGDGPTSRRTASAEFTELLRTAGAEPVATHRAAPRAARARAPTSASGKLEELSALVEREKPDLVAAEGSLSRRPAARTWRTG